MEIISIMIVEDESLIALNLKEKLEDLDYSVSSIVNSGENAILQAEVDRPDIILMDIHLKGEMDGIEAAEIINSSLRIPIIFATAHAEEKYLIRAKLTHPYGYLIKPVQERDLHVTLKMALYASRLDAKRRQAEERFRALVETSSDWIWETDKDGVYTYVSPKVEGLLGFKPETVVGKTPFDLMPEDEASRVMNFFQAVIADQKPFKDLENINQHKDGNLIVLETSGAPFFDSDGTFMGHRGIDRDITERKHAESEKGRLIAELQKALAEIKKLSGLVPICANCKKIRDDKGYWNQIESYIEKYSEAQFSHGVCPDCVEKLYPKQYERMKKKGIV